MISKKSALTSILLSSSVLLNGCEDDYHLNESTKECKKIAYEKNLILENFIHKKKNELDKKIDAKNQQNDEQRSLLIAAKEVAEYISKNPETVINKEKNDEYIKILKSSTELVKKYEGELQELKKERQSFDEVKCQISYCDKK